MSQAPGLFQCPACNGLVAYTAASCPHCGFRPPTAARGVDLAAIGMGLGGLLVVIGSFLPWATMTGFLSVSVSGIDGGRDGMVTMALGIVLALTGALAIFTDGTGWISRGIAVLAGLLAFGVAAYDGINLARLSASSLGLIGVSAGVGIYMVLMGAGLAVLASVLAPGRLKTQG
jgi:hypothetical protein